MSPMRKTNMAIEKKISKHSTVQNRVRVDYNGFVDAWLTATTFDEVLGLLPTMEPTKIQEIFLTCCRKGLALKRLPGQPQRGGNVDWGALKDKVNGH